MILKKWVKEWAGAVFKGVIIVLIMYIFLWPVKIDGSSMENTFINNDRVFVSRIFALSNDYKAGDIIVFKLENIDIDIVKRVIAVGGQHIKIHNGNIFVDENILFEEYAKGITEGNVDMIVPEGHFFVMGDNRQHSTDSRIFGVIPKNDISGKVIIKFFPLSEFKFY